MKRLAVLAVLAAAPIFAQAQDLGRGLDGRLSQNHFHLYLEGSPHVAKYCGQFSGVAAGAYAAMTRGMSKRDAANLAIPVAARYGVQREEALLALDLAESAMESNQGREGGNRPPNEVQRMAFGLCIGSAWAVAGIREATGEGRK